jgi:Tol biopolymer transport system component
MISNDGVPKILDFGLAQINSAGPPDDAMTDPGQIVGTPSYMSPEQAEGKETDRCTDIFSLGVVMYEALTAKRPFGGETNAQVITSLINCEPEKISAVRGDLPRLISRLIMRCLAKRPRDRVRSMHEVSTILTEAKALRMIGPATESFGRRLYRETVHVSHYRSVGAATAIVLSAVGLWYYFASSGRPPVTLEKMTMRRLTQSNNVASVAVTPDGKSIVYATYDKGGRRSMWLRRVDDANPIQLLSPQSSVQFWARPVISDDGGQIYYLTAGNAAAQGSIYRISALGGPPRKLVDGVNFIGSVSRDGQKILYVRLGSPTQILSANAADGGNETALLTSPNADISYKEPHVSADGKVIFYVKNERIDGVNNWSLNSMPAGGGDSTEIFRQKENLGEICPLPNSAAVLVTSNDPATNLKQIFYVSLVDGKRVKLTNDLNYYRGLSIDNSGNIATTQLTDAARVLVGPADDLESLTPLTNQTNACCVVDWAPDGRVVFDAYENNKAHIWISDADGKTTQLTASDSEDTDPHVSGDGRFVVFTSNRSGPNQIWRMNVDGSNPVLLANVAGYTQKPQFAADGRTVMFYWNDAGRERIGKVPVEGGSVETMTELPGGYTYYWAASPDGRLIAHTYREPGGTRSKVAVRPVDSETPLIVLDIWPTSFLKWAPDSKSLFYRERETTPGYENKVLQIDLVRRVPKAVLDSDPDGVHDLAFSRDGKRAAIVRGRALADAVLISGYAGN